MNTVIREFIEVCSVWYENGRTRHCAEARQVAYKSLERRHSLPAIIKHQGSIKAILDNKEAKVVESIRN